jgi:hypothetical protein
MTEIQNFKQNRFSRMSSVIWMLFDLPARSPALRDAGMDVEFGNWGLKSEEIAFRNYKTLRVWRFIEGGAGGDGRVY